MKFQLHTDMNNAAFEDEPLEEVARILRDVASKIEAGNDEGPIRDENGNTVGRFAVTLDEESDR